MGELAKVKEPIITPHFGFTYNSISDRSSFPWQSETQKRDVF